MKCTKCEHENSEESKFCESCGDHLQSKCPECGAFNSSKTKFCEQCGHKLATNGKPTGPASTPRPVEPKPLVERQPTKPEIALVAPPKPQHGTEKPAPLGNDTKKTLEQSTDKLATSVILTTVTDKENTEQSQKRGSIGLQKNSSSTSNEVSVTKDAVSDQVTCVKYSSLIDASIQPHSKKLEEIVNLMQVAAHRAKFHVAPKIPEKKLNGALKKYATDVSPNKVLMLFDTTVFGGGGEGILFSEEKIYGKDLGSSGKVLKLTDINTIAYKHANISPQIFINGQLFVTLNNTDEESMNDFVKHIQQWADILKLAKQS